MVNNEADESKPYICFDKFITDDSSAMNKTEKAKVCSNYYESGNYTNDRDFINTGVNMKGGCCVKGEEEDPNDKKIGDLGWDGKTRTADSKKGELKKFKIYTESDIKKYLALKYILPYKKIWDEKINVTKYFDCPNILECSKFDCNGNKGTCGSEFSGDHSKKYGDWGECGETSDGNKKFCKRGQYCKVEDSKGKCSDSEFSCPRDDWGNWGFGSSWSWGGSFPKIRPQGWSLGDWNAAQRENRKRCGFRNMEGFKDYDKKPNYIDKNNARDDKCLTRDTGSEYANYYPKKEDSPWGVYGDPYTVTFKQKIENDLEWNKNKMDKTSETDEWNLGKSDGSSDTVEKPERHLENRKHKIWTENRDTSRTKLKRCFAKFKTLFIGLDEDLLKVEKLLGGITVKDRNKAYEVEEELRKFKNTQSGEEKEKKLQEFDRASYVFYEIFFYSMLITVSGLFIKNQIND